MGMSNRAQAAAITAILLIGVTAGDARGQCCPGYSLATACSGVALTKSRWCIQNTVPTGQNALPVAFCRYGDKVISTLESLFNIQAPSTFEFELDTQTGGAHTGTACNGLGNGTAYDAFAGSAYGAMYYWGYLLSLHEAINDWTGMSSGGWPTDWWADHQSAFPNMMDFHIMNTIGVANADANLLKAAAAQKGRFYPGGDSADPKVVALDNVFAAMPKMDGYAGFSHLFALQSGDGVGWDNLGVGNPDVKRSEYVAAYMSLAAEQAVLPILQGPGPNGGGNICNGTPDRVAGDAPYTCSEAHIDAIANAHCAIVANGRPAAALSQLRSGNYSGIPSGPCGSSCPAECGCDANNHCVAGWLGARPDAGGGATPDAGPDAGGGAAPDAGRSTTSSTGADGGGADGSGIAMDAGVASPNNGSASGASAGGGGATGAPLGGSAAPDAAALGSSEAGNPSGLGMGSGAAQGGSTAGASSSGSAAATPGAASNATSGCGASGAAPTRLGLGGLGLALVILAALLLLRRARSE
jgi:hypothetical protein